MDAQNAAEATSTKPNASSTASASRVPDSQRQKSTSASAASVSRSPTLSRAAPPSARDSKSSSKPSATSATASSSAKERSRGSAARTASPTSTRDAKASASSSRDIKQDDDGGTDGNSEAETIVLSKDGSPSKPRSRKVIKHEDKDKPNGTSASSAVLTDLAPPSRRQAADKKDGSTEKRDKGDKGDKSAAGDASDGASVPKKKRLHERLQPGSARTKDTSSSLSSAPASPPRSRNTSSRPHSGSDSDRGPRTKSPKRSSSTASKDRLRPPEKLVPHKRKAPKVESDDDAEGHSARRLRLASAGAGGDGTSHSSKKESSRSSLGNNGNANGNGSGSRASASRSNRDASQNRSLSPQPRPHRRSLSTQLQSQSSGLGLKKKRVPAPLQSTDYNSDDSSASASPHIRSAKLRRLATPATAESATSPAKTATHKKHLDAHGQTYLAKACSRGELDLVKQRLGERPSDLDYADFAGNTPLQIAALNGYGEIVKFLIDAGCNLDCVNNDKDTPLLDAVDNGHLDVVKLLLDAGVNPRKANVNGEEPLDRATDDIDNCEEIRAALIEAKKKVGERRLTSEEHRHETDDLRSHNSHNPDSPQRSPAPTSRRPGTIRATKTSNHLLYMPMDDKTLRQAAGRGDEENVIRILQVRDTFDDPESMVAASRGGHDIILQMLLALGKANPDPAPISSAPPEHATPILAAIGQENIKIISLLLEQSSFDPTKRFNGNTYYEIARQRQGPNWKEEEDMLKKAYDSYKKSHGNSRTKDKDVESRRSSRAVEQSDDTPSARAHKRKLSSPSQERPKKSATGSKAATPLAAREEKSSQKRSSDHATSRGDGKASTTATAKSRQRNDRSPSVSNRDTPPPPKQSTKSKKLDSDSIAVSSEGESVKPRRKKLISGRELKDEKVLREKERERQRRASIASTKAPTPPKDASSPREPRSDDTVADKEKARAEKHRDRDRDRARQLKKEGLKESASGATGEGVGKRNRLSETPPNANHSDKDTSEAPIKRRKLEVDNGTSKERRPSKGSAPPDDTPAKALASSKASLKRRDDDDRKTPSGSTKTKKRDPSSDRGRQDSSKPSVSPVEKSIHVKSEDVDVEMADVSSERRSSSGASAAASAEAEAARQKEEDMKKKAEAKAQAEAKKKEDEEREKRRRRQEEEDEKRQKEEKRKKEEEKRRREEAEEEARLKEEAEKKKKKEEEEKQKQRKKLEEEERRRKEEERKQKEEEEKKRLEEEEKEKKRRQEEEERKRKLLEEEERKKREEEERLRQEQLEKEAAEEARRKLEEEERKKREQEEQERIAAEKKAAEELRRRQLEEEERVRVAKLPPALQWLSLCDNPKQPATAQLFKTMQGVRYDCINVDATGTAEGREQWLLNTQVALILGEKDLTLSQFPTWRRLPVGTIAKRVIWGLEGDRYSLTDPDFYDLGKQLPNYYDGQDPKKLGTMAIEKLRRDAWEKFAATDMFFVKVSDVMNIIPNVPHLRDVRLALVYRELPDKEAQLLTFTATHKWKNDPNADELLGFAPGTKYFINGSLVGQHRPGMRGTCKTPPPEVRVPRRGLVAVPVDDPEFASISKSMGIDPLSFPGYAAFVLRQQNGLPSVPSSRTPSGHVNGTVRINGSNRTGPAHTTSPHNSRPPQPIVNGINGTKSG